METPIQLIKLNEEHTIAMKEEMQEAFLHGFQAYQKDDGEEDSNHWQVLPDEDFYRSLRAEGAEAYEAVDADGQRVGGAIITIDSSKKQGELMEQREQSQASLSFAESRQKSTIGQLAFLYVKVGVQSRGIGQAIWKAIETMHPEVEVWETCTPYFDRRNIHFYINRCGFHAIEFFNEHHPDPHMPEQFDQEDGLFVFEKRMKNDG
jgi:GNAT superfamily N-acetyltransferase